MYLFRTFFTFFGGTVFGLCPPPISSHSASSLTPGDLCFFSTFSLALILVMQRVSSLLYQDEFSPCVSLSNSEEDIASGSIALKSDSP